MEFMYLHIQVYDQKKAGYRQRRTHPIPPSPMHWFTARHFLTMFNSNSRSSRLPPGLDLDVAETRGD